MSKKIVVVGAGNTGKTVAEQMAKHDFIHDVTICDTKPKEIKQMEDLQNELAGAMLASYASKWKDYGKPKGGNKQPKKKKRKKNKKTHR